MSTLIQNAVAQTTTPPNPVGEAKKKMQALIDTMQGEIKKALPSVITPERFTRMVFSALSTTPKLAQCTASSFLGAMMQAAQLGLEPNTPLGQAYLIPYTVKGVPTVQFQIGYKGLIDLAYRSGEIESIQAHVVYENDSFDFNYGLEPKLMHKPCVGERGKATNVYAVFKTKNGGFGYEVMTMEDVRRHAEKYSKSFTKAGNPWQTNFEDMAKKTVLKRVLKYAPLKSDFVRAVMQDETIKTGISEDMSDTIILDDFVEVDEETGEVLEGSAT